jgi:mannonate dehydratase
MAKHFASRTHFVHLRSTQVEPNGNFQEASHLGGRAHITELVRIFESQNPLLPMRVDHGPLILNDEKQGYNAGYSFHGRMLALGQIQGILAVIDEELGKKDILDSKNYRHLITIG